jgi:hypothetical protein
VKHDPEKMIKFLPEQEEPQAVERIRVYAGISHWSMALSARAKSEFEERAKAITEAFAEIKKERGFV